MQSSLSESTEVLSVLKRQCPEEMAFSPVLKQIIANAERNATALPEAKRHPEIKFLSPVLDIHTWALLWVHPHSSTILPLRRLPSGATRYVFSLLLHKHNRTQPTLPSPTVYPASGHTCPVQLPVCLPISNNWKM